MANDELDKSMETSGMVDGVKFKVLQHDDVGDVANWDARAFVARHGSVETEILDVHGHELGIASGEDAV
jgi:hypothetical protein